MNKAKKKQNRKPTLKQKRAVLNMVENGGIVSKAMRDAGYSEKTANDPAKLTNSIAFAELAEQYLPDDLLLKIHEQGLAAVETKSVVIGYEPGSGKGMKSVPIVEIQHQPDFAVRHKYLDTAYKIRGKIKQDNNILVPINLGEDRQKYA